MNHKNSASNNDLNTHMEFLGYIVEMNNLFNLDFIPAMNKVGALGFTPFFKPSKVAKEKCEERGVNIVAMGETTLTNMSLINREAYVFSVVIYMMAKDKLKNDMTKVKSIDVKPHSPTKSIWIFEKNDKTQLRLEVTESTVAKFINNKF